MEGGVVEGWEGGWMRREGGAASPGRLVAVVCVDRNGVGRGRGWFGRREKGVGRGSVGGR